MAPSLSAENWFNILFLAGNVSIDNNPTYEKKTKLDISFKAAEIGPSLNGSSNHVGTRSSGGGIRAF